ncbi:MAG: hypothetical protein FGF50_11575 [Candidatus Brockarchaeota archaeon]|nr:hypothetical protein [Candidatus Brockarchaeota archaeon]
MYHKEELVAIVEVKTTSISKYYPKECLKEAAKSLKRYFTSDYKDAKLGISVAIYLDDLDKIIETEFKEGLKCIIWGIAKEEFKKSNEEIVEEILRSFGQP